MSKYLVTGIAGFIGSNIARALLERGEHVRGIDNFATGKPENLAGIFDRIEFHDADLKDPEAAAKVCRGIDYVLHQAAIPSVPRSVTDPRTSHENNINATLNLLLAARDAGVKRVVYAASSSAYGDTPTLPKHEDMRPNPISPYAVGKLTGELYMQSFWRVYGLETVSLRYFNVFGPHQDANSQYSGVLAKFITLMLRNQRPTIFGDGEQSRDFTYIENVVGANLLACQGAAAEVAGKVFNIAVGNRISLNQVFTVLQRLTGFQGKAHYAPERPGDIRHSLADIARARQHLHYVPGIDLEAGLLRTVEWYRQSGLTNADNRMASQKAPA
jgi:nucleoside-diphosphate-sugar epimerase